MSTTNSIIDRMRLSWLSARYDFWLDLNSVARRDRRELRNELRSNVSDAGSDVGVAMAISNVGSVRHLARQTALDGDLRSPWSAGITAGLSTLVGLIVGFLLLSLYYVEGVLDSGGDEVVSSWLFPFFGSQIAVQPETTAGIGFDVSPGPLPFIAALLVFVLVAKPWRAIRRQSAEETVSAH